MKTQRVTIIATFDQSFRSFLYIQKSNVTLMWNEMYVNQKMNFTAPFHAFNEKRQKHCMVQPQNAGHYMNATTYRDSLLGSEGLVLQEQSVKVSNSNLKLFFQNFDCNFFVRLSSSFMG